MGLANSVNLVGYIMKPRTRSPFTQFRLRIMETNYQIACGMKINIDQLYNYIKENKTSLVMLKGYLTSYTTITPFCKNFAMSVNVEKIIFLNYKNDKFDCRAFYHEKDLEIDLQEYEGDE